jgi:hypothetical protein
MKARHHVCTKLRVRRCAAPESAGIVETGDLGLMDARDVAGQSGRLTLTIAVAFGGRLGCAPANEHPELAAAIESAVVEAGDGGLVDLADVIPSDWDTVYGFPSDIADSDVSKAIDADFGPGDDSRYPSDGGALVVLVKQGKVVAWVVLNRSATSAAVRFDEDIYGKPIKRGAARYRVIRVDTTVGGLPLYRLRSEP